MSAITDVIVIVLYIIFVGEFETHTYHKKKQKNLKAHLFA